MFVFKINYFSKVKKTKVLIVFLVSIFISAIYAQNSNGGRIINANDSNLIENVFIRNIESDSTFLSKNGRFKILNSGTYQFSKEGFQLLTRFLKKNKSYTIKLSPNFSQLDEIVVQGNYIPTRLRESTSSISFISTKAIERGNTININESLNRVPGVFMQTGALNTNRITIRGVGSRTLFGTSKIRAYYDNIPLTNGSGETSLEDFELGAISRIEITKGATSSIYGAGLGGVIQLLPKQANLNSSGIKNETTFGSFGLFKNLAHVSFSNDKNSLRLAYSTTSSDGFRNNNDYDRQSITLNSSHQLNRKSEVTILGLFSDLKAFIPSSLNENDFRDNPKSAAFTWAASKGFEDTQRGIFGVSFKHKFSESIIQNTSLFTSFRNSYEPRPFNILDESVFGYGLRHSYSGQFNIHNKLLKWHVGLEFFKDSYKYRTFENLYQDFPEGTGSVQGIELSNFKEKRRYYNIFVEGRYSITKKTDITLGLNFNKTNYNLEDKFPISNSNPDQSGSFRFNGLVSPKLGLLFKANKDWNIFTNISHGFSPLSLEEVLLPDGQINNDLNPEAGWNFEIGTRGSLFQNKLIYNISAYRLAIKNLLVARRTSQDEFIGVNAGRTHHDGIEIDIVYNILNTTNMQLSIFSNYTLNHYRFKDFIDGDNNFSGNKLTGVPSGVVNAGIDFNSTIGIYGNINYQHVGKIPITDSNNLFSDSYNLTNAKLGYRKTLTTNLQLNAFFGINNIFDEAYASQILINASSFGSSLPRYYYPGNPINYYSAVSLNYSF